MARLINLDSQGKERTRLAKGVVLAVRELARQEGPGAEALDLAAFIALALQQISDGIDPSVAAWEKRGYWVKADRFRMDWAWTADSAAKIREATLTGQWGSLASLAAHVGQRLASVNLPARHRLGTPWKGAFEVLRSRKEAATTS